MRGIGRLRRCAQKIAAHFRQYWKERAAFVAYMPTREAGRGEALAQDHSATADERGAGSNHTADAVIQRQTVVHAILGPTSMSPANQ